METSAANRAADSAEANGVGEAEELEQKVRETAIRYVKIAAAVIGVGVIVGTVIVQATMQHAYGISADLMQQVDRTSPNPNYFPDQYTNQATIREDHIQAF